MQSNGTAAGNGRDENPSSLRRFAALLRPYASRFVLVLVVLFVLTGVNMMLPWFTKLLLDDVFPHDNWSLLWLILGGILVVYVLRNLLYFTSKFTTVGVGENVCFHLRNRLFERMQQMSLQFYQKNPPGQISSRVMDDTFVIQSFIQDELPKLLQSVIMFQALLVILYVTNWQLALAATIVLPGHLWAARWFKRPIKSSSKEAQQQLGVVHGNLIEKFLGVEVVKGFTAEQRESEAFQQAINASRKSQMRSKTYHVTQKVVADLLVGVGTIALIGFGSYQVLKPRDPMQPGVFMAFFAYVLMLYPTVLELMSGFAKLTKSSASIDRVFEMMETTEGEQEIAAPIVVPIRGHIRFENVSFRYNDGPPVLRSMSFEIPAGQTCAIIGPSGAGKSTLVSMVPRFIEAQLGQVQVDGVDVGKLDLRHLRESIGIAFQECFLFDSSVFENLRYARPDATMNQIVEVAKRTGAHDFISKLPNGYGTIIGRDGVSMSRGERQRITLTRAMLKNPKVLILDEATASIDTVSESQIIPAILEFMRGKTTLMITHRPELVRHADIVLQLVDGRIEYQGPPEELPSDALGTHMDDARTQSSREDWGLTRSWLLAAAIGLSCLLGGPALGQDKQPAEEPPAEQENQQEQPAEAGEQNQERPDRPPAQPAAEPAFGMLLPMPNLVRGWGLTAAAVFMGCLGGLEPLVGPPHMFA